MSLKLLPIKEIVKAVLNVSDPSAKISQMQPESFI